MAISISGSNSISGLSGNDTNFDKVLEQLKIDATVMGHIEEDIKATQYDLDHLTEYAVAYYERIRDKYGKGRERRTELREFDSIEATKVAVTNAKGRKSELAPNQMYFSSGEHDYITAVDVEEYVSWKDGNYKFRNEKIATIVKRLSKYYNINIVADPSTSGLTCSGELILKDELIRVLDVICNTAQIQYTWDSEKRTYMLHR